MTAPKLIISPKTKVGELLDVYPELEPVLMSMSPAFEKLRNPVLRKTVARVATFAAGIYAAPILDMLRAKNFRIHTVANESYVLNYICK